MGNSPAAGHADAGSLSFVLSGPDTTLVAHGIHTAFADVAAAQSALRSGSSPIIMGALPFDVSQPSALMRPRSHEWSARPPGVAEPAVATGARRYPRSPRPANTALGSAHALTALRDPGNVVSKVVLARAIDMVADAELDAPTVLQRLAAADPRGYTYFADLTPAGGAYQGAALVGASPELLVARRGERVSCRPFAGSAPRSADMENDRANAAALAESAKNRHEHALVVDAMRKTLDPLCVDVEIAPAPQLSRTAAVWHLSTPISARIRDKSTTALDLALALHPTPAVCGVPVDASASMIRQLEGDRGFYAGATGWSDQHGDGSWVISIRCAQLSADRLCARAYAGGGIVAESDPEDELTETTAKFTTVLAALGVTA